MKLKLKYFGILTIGLIVIIFSTPLLSNLWGLLTGNGYIIPEESSILTFKPTKMNDGNGDYWIYGEDYRFYYSTMLKGENDPYIKISKERTSLKGFNKYNFKTWDNKYLCGDLLKIYAQKPTELKFIKCNVIEDSQTKIKAIYQVDGKESYKVEDFLVRKYGMGKLRWICCGWEVGGKYGKFENSELNKIHPHLSVKINMYASGEVKDKNELSKTKLNMNRNTVDDFTVIVELILI